MKRFLFRYIAPSVVPIIGICCIFFGANFYPKNDIFFLVAGYVLIIGNFLGQFYLGRRRFARERARVEELRIRGVYTSTLPLDVQTRALEYFISMLSLNEQQCLENYGYIHVIGASGRVYTLYRFPIAHVHVWRENIGYCVVPTAEMPLGDYLLAMKLALETDDRGLTARAGIIGRTYTSE